MAVDVRVELTLNCEDLSCLLFSDVTKEYSASNLGGYCTPNFPCISEITSIDFIVTDSDDVEWVFENAPYLPNAAGTSTICLNGDDFVNEDDDTLEFAGGETYTLTYKINVGSGTALEVSDEFLYACCGAPVASNLGINFSIQENTGCTSITLTDTTGSYSSENQSGYGSPNPSYSDIESTLIRVTFNDNRVVDIVNFIPTQSVPYVTINNQTLGFGTDEIPSQVVSIEYSVYKAGKCRIGYASSQVLLRCQLENCIAAQAAILLGNSYCDQKQIDSVMALIWKYNQLVIASQGQISCVVGEAEKLYKKCSQGQPPCN